MKEASFIKQNAEKWAEYEKDTERSPDKLSERYVQLTDDLSYSRTFYPDSQVTQYLNTLTGRLFGRIYANKRESKNRFLFFWKQELPYIFYDSQKQLLYSFLFFTISVLIGVFSAKYDQTFVRLILGDEYVNQTLENIARGKPMDIYASMDQATMFVQIAYNNIMVSFLTMIGMFSFQGLTLPLFTIGTVWNLFRNGVMLGCFQYFFAERGLLLDTFLVIWIHGTLEISAIVIAGCAGLVMGNGLLFPQTYSRTQSFMAGAKQAIKIAIGLVPIFIVAAFLEGFVTRISMHPAVSLAIILTSASFIVWYFVIYPIKLRK
jgi:uncharacterized membrane protein SpoIIM required for sporulation